VGENNARGIGHNLKYFLFKPQKDVINGHFERPKPTKKEIHVHGLCYVECTDKVTELRSNLQFQENI